MLQVIRSLDAVSWEDVAILPTPDPALPDMRDPKVLVRDTGELILLGTATNRSGDCQKVSYLWTSLDGVHWSYPKMLEKSWLWSLAAEGSVIYSAGYSGNVDHPHSIVTLYSDEFGEFEPVSEIYSDARYPNETSIVMSNREAIAIVRREFQPGQLSAPPFNNGTALLGTSVFPYANWTCTDLNIYLGGPQLCLLPGGKVLVAARAVTPEHHTCLWEVCLSDRTLKELLILPSGGDCGYPGIVWHDDKISISYYSSHEGKPSIYFAQLEIADEPALPSTRG